MIHRYLYSNSIQKFLESSNENILGQLSQNSQFTIEYTQRDAWLEQIKILKQSLQGFDGAIYFEYAIPRMGKRIDVVLIISSALFVLEFKVGEKEFLANDVEQVWDYALDLKNFHETSHDHLIAPILVATEGKDTVPVISTTLHNDNLLIPVKTNKTLLSEVINGVLEFSNGEAIKPEIWQFGRYSPTPTIIEAAKALYAGHSVKDISRSDATAQNLSTTSNALSNIILTAKEQRHKAICFVTGVPGAGKTLVGLDIATKHFDKGKNLTSVFLSGNGPLVAILREALTRDKVHREKEMGRKVKKGEVLSQVKAFIQNVHHFRDECLIHPDDPPFDHIAIFDEAQRAWNHEQTEKFMASKKKVPKFSYSEPEFLISCLDRHKDWAVIICLVGGGQEINTGEAGITEWIESLNRSFPHWHVYISNRLTDSEYAAGKALQLITNRNNVFFKQELHLAVSLRSFRAEHLSLLVKNLLDINIKAAMESYSLIKNKYPIAITRDLSKAKEWLKKQARGSERYGLVVSSKAQRLKPLAIDIRSPINPINWFLNGKEDTRSSFYLEDVATEFHIQGLELDWACVIWDGDFRYSNSEWQYFSFEGSKWRQVLKEERRLYLKNAYRVLLTRARQGMIIVVPTGTKEDPTRNPKYYDSTFEYLMQIGFEVIR